MKECPSCHRCFDDMRSFCPDDGAPLRTVFEGIPILDRKYRLLQLLGAGGGGHVYKCRHLGLKRLVAVKVLRPHIAGQRQHIARFRREAEILGRLRHPHIVEVTDFGVDAERGIPYLVMEYLEGETLSERIREMGPMALDDALVIFEQIASGIDHAHAAGILHRDLKASNVFLTGDGTRGSQVKLMDFGLASVMASPEETPVLFTQGSEATSPESADLTDPETVIGTPGYQAPEVLEGQAPTTAADVYAFGVLMSRSSLLDKCDAALSAILAGEPAARPASARLAVETVRHAARRVQRRHRLMLPVAKAAGAVLSLAAATAIGSFIWSRFKTLFEESKRIR